MNAGDIWIAIISSSALAAGVTKGLDLLGRLPRIVRKWNAWGSYVQDRELQIREIEREKGCVTSDWPDLKPPPE